MAIFSKYSAVLEADGSPMTVKNALRLINRFLAEDDFDSETSFASSGLNNMDGRMVVLAKLINWLVLKAQQLMASSKPVLFWLVPGMLVLSVG
jgi:adenine-specific DNA methylase